MYDSAIALQKGIKAEFSKLMATKPANEFAKMINRVKSNSNEEKYWIPGTVPGFKEWIDARHFGDFGDKNLTVVNKHWDSGLQVERDTLDDTREFLGGNVESWIKMLVDKYTSFPAKAVQLILDANTAAFDATAIFATSRPNLDTGSNTINNLTTGTSSTTYSLSEFEADYKAAKALIIGFKDKDSEPFNEAPRLGVVVPAHMEDVAKTLLAQRQQMIYVSGSQTNLYAGDAEIIVNYRQGSSDNDWYLVNLANSFAPFVIQDRKGPEWMMKDDAEYLMIKYGVDFRMGYGPLNPMAIVKTNN